jgi:carbon-monoxide dehydrogenase large subunit
MHADLEDDPAHGVGSLIGARLPRPGITRLLRGRGRYVSDIKLPRMLHLAFVRSQHSHARIVAIDTTAALMAPGVVKIVIGADLVTMCRGLSGIADNRVGHKGALQPLMAVEVALWQGQPVAAVLAETRAEAEDGAELVDIIWDILPAVTSAAEARAAPPIHAGLSDNLSFEHRIAKGDVDRARGAAAHVVSQSFRFHRQTAMTLEPRGLIASYDAGDDTLTVHHSHQSPLQMQTVFATHLGITEHKVRVIAPDVGGGFGLKINVFAEEVAVAAISCLVRRPVKFIADRLESFTSDAHVRDHVVTAEMAVDADGRITAMTVDDLANLGAFGMPIRFSIAEGMMLVTNAGSPYRFENYQAVTRNLFSNTPLIGMYRGVGIPLSTVVTEILADLAADKLGIDPVEFRRRNYVRGDDLPGISIAGTRLPAVSFAACLDRLTAAMDYPVLRAEQAALRSQGVWRGIGIATFSEPTAYGPAYYGPTGAAVSVQDGCTLRLEASGAVRCTTSVTDQGQGTLAGLAQIIAGAVGVAIGDVEIVTGDSAASTYGGGAWASRGMAIGGEAALKAAQALVQNILTVAAAISQSSPDALTIADGEIRARTTGVRLMSLAEVARIGYFRQDTLPPDLDVQFAVTRSHVANNATYYTTVGVQACYLELDPGTGFIKLLRHWAVTDCGRVINPLLVDEQLRGGIVQGLGAVLYEECIYDTDGNLLNGSLADYLVPMAGEMPDIHVECIATPERSTMLGAKGVGEAGLIGAMGAVWCAVNDALRPLGAHMAQQPFTPERVLDAIAEGGV